MVFKLFSILRPDPNAFHEERQKDLAIENFKKSLQFDPGNGNARKMLEELEGK